VARINQTGTADNGLPVTLSSATDEPKFFSSTSFSGTSGTLSGGVNETYTPGTVYNYTIAGSGGASGYAANGNLVSYTDLMDGGWTLNYDNVNRVSSATATSGVWNNLTLSWTYDSFGNRKTQTPSGTNIMAPVPQAQHGGTGRAASVAAERVARPPRPRSRRARIVGIAKKVKSKLPPGAARISQRDECRLVLVIVVGDHAG